MEDVALALHWSMLACYLLPIRHGGHGGGYGLAIGPQVHLQHVAQGFECRDQLVQYEAFTVRTQ